METRDSNVGKANFIKWQFSLVKNEILNDAPDVDTITLESV